MPAPPPEDQCQDLGLSPTFEHGGHRGLPARDESMNNSDLSMHRRSFAPARTAGLLGAGSRRGLFARSARGSIFELLGSALFCKERLEELTAFSFPDVFGDRALMVECRELQEVHCAARGASLGI